MSDIVKSEICCAPRCTNQRDIKKRSSLCSMHRSRWSRNKCLDSPTELIKSQGFVMLCKLHGFLTQEQVNTTYAAARRSAQRKCIECTIQSQKNSRQQNPDKYRIKNRKSNLKKKFGLTLEEFDVLSYLQNHVCAICQKAETTYDAKTKLVKNLTVDHDHVTGKIRGLLCNKCNFGIGYFDDNIDYIASAITYLNAHQCDERLIQQSIQL